MGGSSVKLVADTLALEAVAKDPGNGRRIGGSVWAPVNMHNPYGDFWFYASHLVEICMEVFGTDIRAVQAVKTEKAVIANVCYADLIVSLHFAADVWQNHACTLVTVDGTVTLPLDTAGSLDQEATRFAKLLQGNYESMSYEELVRPVVIMDAILRAEVTGATVFLS